MSITSHFLNLHCAYRHDITFHNQAWSLSAGISEHSLSILVCAIRGTAAALPPVALSEKAFSVSTSSSRAPRRRPQFEGKDARTLSPVSAVIMGAR